MELGNILFGHSRGEFPVDRDVWQAVFGPLFDTDFFGREEFENEIFKTRPYCWDDCECEDEIKPECPNHWPNFVHKPSGLEVRWYKHPFRDSYSNKEVSKSDLRKIVAECVQSLGQREGQ